MKKFNYLSLPVWQSGLVIILILFLTFPVSSYASNKGDGNHQNRPALQKPLLDPAQSLVDINNITCWVGQDGFHDWVVGGSWNGAFPNGVNAGAIFAEGIVWGGKVNDGATPAVRVNGNTYGTGCAPITRLYRVRPDYQNGDLTQDAADFLSISVTDVTAADIQAMRDQYQKDWNEWPAAQGAPYTDVNGNGQYDPASDIPGIPGASQTLFIKYDDSNSPDLYGSPPIGLEVSETYWAYATTGALSNVIYKKVDIVYKGTSGVPANSQIDSMYIVQWADPDVGNSTDDFAGCDTTLNLGYSYSSGATDAVYQGLGLAPPAVGYDFLQGVSTYTGDPNDSAIFNLHWRHGYKYTNPKPMSSFAYFAAGGTWSDPDFTYTGSLQFYNLMRGYLPRPPYPTSQAFPTSVADVTPYGTYLLDGDPVAGIGKIDGSVDGPGDRRIMVTNGPITMNLNDTAQVVVALVGGLGKNNLSSISTMKYNDAFAQYAYDQLFNVPLMPSPNVIAKGLNNKIVLNWSTPDSLVNAIENEPHGSYTFQAYSVYQLPPGSADITQGTRIATYDVVDNVQVLYDKVLDEGTGLTYTKPIVFLDNSHGIQRFLTITQDQVFNKPLANGLNYTFAVTAIAYNNDPGLPAFILESKPTIVNVTPQTPMPGTSYGGTNGDTLTVNHATGKSDGQVLPIILDPSKSNGHNYKVTFDTLAGDYVWNLTDVTTNTVILANQTNQSGDENYQIINGIFIKVIGPPIAINSVSYTGTRWISGTNFGGRQFFGGMDTGPFFWGTTFPAADYVPVELDWTDNPTPSEANGWAQGAVYWRSDSYNYHGVGWMPFQTFDISDPANPVQVNVSFVEDANDGSANLKWDMGWDGSAFAANGGREYTFIHNTAYDPNLYNDTNNGLDNDNMYDIWPSERSGHPYLEAPFTMTIVPNYPNIQNDEFTFTAPKVTVSQSQAKTDINSINVFPNPYYGTQYRESSREDHFVTFSHLPSSATIRIFDLSGVSVRTITHVASSGQFEKWNLLNDSGYPVASGIYVAYVDMPGIGATKILKIAIVQEQQILKVY